MDILIILLWIALFLIIPTSVILIAGNTYGRDEKWLIIGKLLISFFVYSVTTVISLIFSVLVVVGTEPRRGQPMTAKEQIIALLVIYAYGFIGYLLCSFINGSFFKPWKFTLFNSKKPLSIFDSK